MDKEYWQLTIQVPGLYRKPDKLEEIIGEPLGTFWETATPPIFKYIIPKPSRAQCDAVDKLFENYEKPLQLHLKCIGTKVPSRKKRLFPKK